MNGRYIFQILWQVILLPTFQTGDQVTASKTHILALTQIYITWNQVLYKIKYIFALTARSNSPNGLLADIIQSGEQNFTPCGTSKA